MTQIEDKLIESKKDICLIKKLSNWFSLIDKFSELNKYGNV